MTKNPYQDAEPYHASREELEAADRHHDVTTYWMHTYCRRKGCPYGYDEDLIIDSKELLTSCPGTPRPEVEYDLSPPEMFTSDELAAYDEDDEDGYLFHYRVFMRGAATPERLREMALESFHDTYPGRTIIATRDHFTKSHDHKDFLVYHMAIISRKEGS